MKTILIAGTKPTSIGRFIGTALHKQGWDVWLYSRSAEHIESDRWHERSCNVTKQEDINRLLNEMPQIDATIFLADAGGHGALEEVNDSLIEECYGAKLTGSVLLTKSLLAHHTSSTPMTLLWCGGKTSKKPKNIILYSLANAGLVSFVDALNEHYSNAFHAFYLPMGLISPSPLGDAYINDGNEHLQSIAVHPQTISEKAQEILAGTIPVGLVEGASVLL